MDLVTNEASDTCRINIQSKKIITKNVLQCIPNDSPFQQPRKRKNTTPDKCNSLTPGWLVDIFTNPGDSSIGHVELMN